jgi:hypothetical protein
MRKPSLSDYLSAQEKRGAIDSALQGGMSAAEIFAAITKNVYGDSDRKRLIVAWGEKIGLSASESLRQARAANLIATTRMPGEKASDKPRGKKLERIFVQKRGRLCLGFEWFLLSSPGS